MLDFELATVGGFYVVDYGMFWRTFETLEGSFRNGMSLDIDLWVGACESGWSLLDFFWFHFIEVLSLEVSCQESWSWYDSWILLHVWLWGCAARCSQQCMTSTWCRCRSLNFFYFIVVINLEGSVQESWHSSLQQLVSMLDVVDFALFWRAIYTWGSCHEFLWSFWKIMYRWQGFRN